MSDSPDATLTIFGGGPNDDKAGVTPMIGHYPFMGSYVFMRAINYHFGSAEGIAAGTFGAHELVHNLLGIDDQLYNGSPNLMNIDDAEGKVPGNQVFQGITSPIPKGFSSLNGDQVQALYERCKKLRNGGGGGGGGLGGFGLGWAPVYGFVWEGGELGGWGWEIVGYIPVPTVQKK